MFKEAELNTIQKRSVKMIMPIGHPYRSGMNQMAISVKDKIINERIMQREDFSGTLD